jgi:hypothetical protein
LGTWWEQKDLDGLLVGTRRIWWELFGNVMRTKGSWWVIGGNKKNLMGTVWELNENKRILMGYWWEPEEFDGNCLGTWWEIKLDRVLAFPCMEFLLTNCLEGRERKKLDGVAKKVGRLCVHSCAHFVFLPAFLSSSGFQGAGRQQAEPRASTIMCPKP